MYMLEWNNKLKRTCRCRWKNTPVYSVRSLVHWLMSRNRNCCKVFESRTAADVSYSGWRPVTVTGVKYLKIRITRRQPRIFDGHCTRPLVTISVTGHWRILSYVRICIIGNICNHITSPVVRSASRWGYRNGPKSTVFIGSVTLTWL